MRIASAMLPALVGVCSLVSGCTSGSSTGTGTTSAPVVVYSTSSIVATVGVAIVPVIPSVNVTVTGFTVSPALPAGLTLNPLTGAISGMPTQASPTATYVVTATNSAGTGNASVQITVAIAAPSNLVYPQTSISVAVGTAITPDTPTVTGTVTSYTISPALPAGLTINATTGTISGTPTAVSPATTYTVTASNGTGSAIAAVQIAVLVAAPKNLTYPQTSIATPVGTPITPITPNVTGIVTSYTISPALPAGLTINAATGTISGTPTVGSPSTAYTVTASNGTGSTTAALQITVNGSGAPTHLIYPQSSVVAFMGTAITPDTPIVIGTVTSYTISPALPAGLSINATTGAISGTPTSIANLWTYTVTASNQSGSTTAALTISVYPPGLVFNYPQTFIQAVIGTPITPDTPVAATGNPRSYSVNPALPLGLVIDTQTGTISGTPTAASPKITYTVSASGDSGSSGGATLQIEVTPQSPVSIAYPQGAITATLGTAITPDVPTITGALSTFSINPALPPGLNFDPTDGTISGSISTAIHTTAHTVTGTGAGGTATATINITAAAIQPLLDLGTTSNYMSLAITSDRVLASDSSGVGKWVLWDYPAGNVLAEGPIDATVFLAPNVAMAGGLALVPGNGIEVRSSANGSLLFTVDSNAALAPDGSYVYSASSGGLRLWSAGGTLEFTLPGDYSSAKVYAAPNQLQVVNGPYGSNVVETAQVSGGSVTLSPTFNGTFESWFGDGQRFLALQGSVVYVYSSAAALQNTYILSFIPTHFGGYGNWFWVASNPQGQLFQLNNTTPQLTNFVPYFVSGPIVASLDSTGQQVTTYDFSGSSFSSRVTTLPSIEGAAKTFAAYSSTQWVVSNQYGVVLDGATAHAFNYGKALAIAGSSTYAVVETASGQSFIFDANGTQVLATSFAPASFTISQNGNTLGSITYPASASFYALPSMNLIASPSGVVSSINLSANGQFAGIGTYAGNSPSGELLGLPGSITSIPVISSNPAIFPSPDGSLVAAPNQPHGVPDQTTTTAIYHSNGSLVTVVSGNPEGWIDNNSLLVGTYTNTAPPEVMVSYNTSVIYDAAGNVKLTFPQNTLPQLQPPQFIGANEVYQAGTIYSLVTGAAEWNWPSLSNSFSAPSAVVGSGVIFSSGGEISLFPR